jgi:hypothetical protein
VLGQYQDYIGIYEEIVPGDFCDNVITKFESLWQNRLNFENHISDSSEAYGGALNRKDDCIYFEHSAGDYAGKIHDYVGKCFEEYKKKYVGFDGLELFSKCVKVQRTEEGGGFHGWHSEHGSGYTARVAVWCLYLTTHEGNGETEFITQGVRLEPKKGTMVLWPAGHTHPHRGNPVYGDNKKYIATGWLELVCENR